MAIRQLPIELANQIAAGEVVERPASVVKELVENALDAGADQLTIELEQGGIKRIRIRDNGCGIAKDELGLALSRHATSKIASLEDLESIASLGFRGEALASISSVSRLKLTSKPATQEQAWQAWTEGRDMAVSLEPAAHPDGTSIDIQDLFFNTPARRKFLRTEKTEFSHIDEIIRRIALSRFDVEFTVIHQGKRLRHYPKVSGSSDDSMRRRVAKVCGSRFAETALRVEATAAPLTLTGWLAPAEECRHQADIQYCFVNGRMMRDKLLSHAIRQAYERYLLPERVPTYVLYLTLPAQQVDVNVHPAKHEVRFHQQRQVHDFILQAVADGLSQQTSVLTSGAPTEASVPPASIMDTPAQHSAPAPEATRHQYQPTPRTPVNEAFKGYRAGSSILPNAAPVTTAKATSDTSESAYWRALVVMQQRWLVICTEEQLAWLDLRKVQATCTADNIEQQLQQGLSGQPLLVEVSIDKQQLNVPAAQLNQVTEQLNRCGVNFRQRGTRLLVDTVPAMLRHGDVAQHCIGLVNLLRDKPSTTTLAQWLADYACNDSYSLTQAEHWMLQWQQQLNGNMNFCQRIETPFE